MTRAKRTYTTVVADSHNLFRRGLATLIAAESDMAVVGEAVTAVQAIALFNTSAGNGNAAESGEASANEASAQTPPDVLLMEIGLVGGDPEIIKSLRQLSETTSVLLLAPQESAACLEMTVASGARGYMLKTTSPAQLIAGIRQATVREDRGLSPQAPDLNALAESERNYSRTSPLTAREQEVMMLLAEGRTVREVAAELSLSIKTIEAHKLNLMRKLDIHNRASLVEYAVRTGIVTLQPAAAR